MPKQGRTVRSNRTPYERASVSKKEENPGFFGRLKRLFWSQEPPAPLGSPVLLTSDRSREEPAEDNTEASESINGSRITYHSPQRESTPAAQICHVSDFTRSVDNQSMGGQTLLESQPGGPNETLRQFFAEKGDAELSNMEVVGVLSLIGQAVGRDESLVDFSTSEATASTSDMWQSWKQPPTPRFGGSRLGTPRPLLDTTPARPRASRSPWVRPRQQQKRSERQERPPAEGSILQRPERTFVQDPLPRAVLESSTPSKKGTAASAILRAVRKDTENADDPEKENKPASKTSAFGSVFGGTVGDTADGSAGGTTSGDSFAPQADSAAPAAPSVASEPSIGSSKFPSISNPTLSATTFTPAPNSVPISAPAPAPAPTTSEFEFRIPASVVSREMTPADEEFVKQAQQGFKF